MTNGPYLVIPCQYGHQSADEAVKAYVSGRMDIVQLCIDKVGWSDDAAFDTMAKIVLTHLRNGDAVTFKRVNDDITWHCRKPADNGPAKPT